MHGWPVKGGVMLHDRTASALQEELTRQASSRPKKPKGSEHKKGGVFALTA